MSPKNPFHFTSPTYPIASPLPIYKSFSPAITVTTCITSESAPSHPPHDPPSAPPSKPTLRGFIFRLHAVPVLNLALQLAVICGTAHLLPALPAATASPDPSSAYLHVSVFGIWWLALTGATVTRAWCWPLCSGFAEMRERGWGRRDGLVVEAARRERLWGLVAGSFLPWFEALGVAVVGMVVLGGDNVAGFES